MPSCQACAPNGMSGANCELGLELWEAESGGALYQQVGNEAELAVRLLWLLAKGSGSRRTIRVYFPVSRSARLPISYGNSKHFHQRPHRFRIGDLCCLS